MRSATPRWLLDFEHRGKSFQLGLSESGALELYVAGCLRKRRPASGRVPQYVWTNIELEWEEHHYVEARYWADEPRLLVTVNGDPLFDGVPSR